MAPLPWRVKPPGQPVSYPLNARVYASKNPTVALLWRGNHSQIPPPRPTLSSDLDSLVIGVAKIDERANVSFEAA